MVRACTDFTGSLDPSNHGLVSAAAKEFAKGSLSRRTNFPNLVRWWIRRVLKIMILFIGYAKTGGAYYEGNPQRQHNSANLPMWTMRVCGESYSCHGWPRAFTCKTNTVYLSLNPKPRLLAGSPKKIQG